MAWRIYIPEEGHWPIAYNGNDPAEARRAYLTSAGRTRLPAGSVIDRDEPDDESDDESDEPDDDPITD